MNDRYNEAMRRLAAESMDAEPPRQVEKALRAEFERTARRRRLTTWAIVSGAIAASLLVVFFADRTVSTVAPETQVPVASVPVAEPEEPFMAIPYVTPLGPYESAEVVRMNLPAAALISAGVPMRTGDAGAQVEADVLVGQDGRARAVRLVSVSSFN